MRVTIEKGISKFTQVVAEQIRLAEEKEKVYPVTYKCLRCKDKKWFLWMKDGYEYGEPCECQLREWENERRTQ